MLLSVLFYLGKLMMVSMFAQQLMRQDYTQLRTPVFNQQTIKHLENRSKINKSMLKLCPQSCFKTALTLKLTEAIHPSAVVSKYRLQKFKTQQNSPIGKVSPSVNSLCFPQLNVGGAFQQKRQAMLKQNHRHNQRDVAKTAIIMDSLIKYLKDWSETRNNNRQQKRVITLTEERNQFIECEKTKRSKRPKIVKNQITKKFFQGDKERSRRIQSQDRCRKSNNNSFVANQKIGDYTFYGGNTLKIETDISISSKNELNEKRLNRLSNKFFDFNQNGN